MCQFGSAVVCSAHFYNRTGTGNKVANHNSTNLNRGTGNEVSDALYCGKDGVCCSLLV